MTTFKIESLPDAFSRPQPYTGDLTDSSYYLEPCLHGHRAALIFDLDCTIHMDEVQPEVEGIEAVVEELKQCQGIDGLVLDGEFVVKDALTTFHAFDALPTGDWGRRFCGYPLHFRKSVLAMLLMRNNPVRTLFVPTTLIHGADEIPAAMKRLGYSEGVLKDIESEYTFGPTADWLHVR